jgi:hypothetical protein
MKTKAVLGAVAKKEIPARNYTVLHSSSDILQRWCHLSTDFGVHTHLKTQHKQGYR